MPPVDQGMVSRKGIPHLHRPVATARGDTHLIRRPRHSEYRIAMTVISVDVMPIVRVPDLYRRIQASRCYILAIARPGQAQHIPGMTAISVNQSDARGIP